MRVLTIDEVQVASGGGDVADAAQAGGALGGALGVGYGWASGATGTAVLGLGGIGALAGAGLGAAWAGGYAVGSWANSTFGWSDTISDWMTDWF